MYSLYKGNDDIKVRGELKQKPFIPLVDYIVNVKIRKRRTTLYIERESCVEYTYMFHGTK